MQKQKAEIECKITFSLPDQPTPQAAKTNGFNYSTTLTSNLNLSSFTNPSSHHT